MKNVKKVKNEPQPPLSLGTPFKADVFLYGVFQLGISTLIFYFFSIETINSRNLDVFSRFFALLGIYLVSDIIATYFASIIVTGVVKRVYDVTYFKSWLYGSRRNVLKVTLYWILNAVIYVAIIQTGLLDTITYSFLGGTTWAAVVLIYILIKGVALLLATGISIVLLNVERARNGG